MHRVLFTSLGLVFLLFISGCNSDHSHETDFRICKKQATISPNNIHSAARNREIESRGLNCRKFASEIDKEVAQDNLAKARIDELVALKRLAKANAPKSNNPYLNPYGSSGSNSTSEPFKPRELYKSKTYCRRTNILVLCN